MAERITSPEGETFSKVKLTLPLEGHRVIFLRTDPRIIKLDFGDGIF